MNFPHLAASYTTHPPPTTPLHAPSELRAAGTTECQPGCDLDNPLWQFCQAGVFRRCTHIHARMSCVHVCICMGMYTYINYQINISRVLYIYVYIHIHTENDAMRAPVFEDSIFRCFSCMSQQNSTLNVYVSHTCDSVFFVYSH